MSAKGNSEEEISARDSARLGDAKKRLLDLQQEITKATLAIAGEIDALANDLPQIDVTAFLVTECLISRREVRSYAAMAKAFAGREQILSQRKVSARALMSMSTASSDVREEAFQRISSGSQLNSIDISKIASDLRTRTMSFDEIAREKRLRLLDRRARTRGRDAARQVEPMVDGLLTKIQSFYERHCTVSDYEDFHMDPESSPYKEDHAHIVAGAVDALNVFERAFGSEQLPRSEWASHSKRVRRTDNV